MGSHIFALLQTCRKGRVWSPCIPLQDRSSSSGLWPGLHYAAALDDVELVRTLLKAGTRHTRGTHAARTCASGVRQGHTDGLSIWHRLVRKFIDLPGQSNLSKFPWYPRERAKTHASLQTPGTVFLGVLVSWVRGRRRCERMHSM